MAQRPWAKPRSIFEILPWATFVVFCLAYYYVMFSRFNLAVIVPDLSKDFSIDPVQVGLLSSLYLWGYGAVQVPTGLLSDMLGVRRGLTICLLVAGVGTLMFAIAPSYWVAALGRTIAGVGTGMFLVSALKYLTQWFRTDYFATLYAVMVVCGSFGSLSAASLLERLVTQFGWRSSFLALAIFGALLGVLVFLFVRDKAKVPSSNGEKTGSQTIQVSSPKLTVTRSIKLVFGNRNLWLLGIAAFTYYGTTMTVQGLWGVSYLMDVQGFTHQMAADAVGMIPFGGMVGTPIAGFLSDRVMPSRKSLVVVGVTLVSLLYLVFVINPPFVASWMCYGLLFCVGLCGSTYSTLFALVNDIVPREISGTATGFFNTFNFIGGGVYTPVTGAILAAFPTVGSHIVADAYRAIFMFCVVGLWIGVLAVFSTKTLPKISSQLSP